MNGAGKSSLQELPRIRDRLSFLYVEHCVINRSDSAISVTDVKGVTNIPVAIIGVLLIGPGSNVTHRAMELLGDSGACVMWVGEKGIRCYSCGRPLTHSSRLLEIQARKVSNIHSRLAVARRMYEMRFPGEDFSRMTMQQLRGREGSRVRSAYKKASKETGIWWSGRNYDPNDFDSGDVVNQALSAANVCLYGIAHSVIVALGCSPGLGFIHTGHDRSFVYDLADIYKADLSIPLAFRIAKEGHESIGSVVRRAFRDEVANSSLMVKMAHDIIELLTEGKYDEADPASNDIFLWDNKEGNVSAGVSYREGETF